MKKHNQSSITKITLYSVFFVVLDQAVKINIIRFLPDIVSENPGVLFGYISNNFIKYTLILLSFAILIYLVKISDLKNKYIQISFSLIIAGAISNFLDRLINGYVVDYISLPSILAFWPKFNLADIFIVVGVVIYIFFYLGEKNAS